MKVSHWQLAVLVLKEKLPEGDEVLSAWSRRLSTFEQHLPYLIKLSSEEFKVNQLVFADLSNRTSCIIGENDTQRHIRY